MELRSRRSQSRGAPLRRTEEYEISSTGHENHIQKSVRTVKTEKIVTSYGMEEVLQNEKNENSHSSLEHKSSKTSDYSSSEGESDAGSSLISKIQKKASKLINNHYGNHDGAKVSALQLYREAGEYWNKFPKTDYTYSPHSKDRIELAPGVVQMPNMSRRSLHQYSSAEQFKSNNYQEEHENNQNEKLVFHDTKRKLNYGYDTVDSYSYKSSKRSYWQVIITTVTTVLTTMWAASVGTATSSVLWLASQFYKIVSWTLLFDTWLLQRSVSGRRATALGALLLLPFLLLLGWWLLPGALQAFYSAVSSLKASSSSSLPPVYVTENVQRDSEFVANTKELNIDEIIAGILQRSDLKAALNRHESDAEKIRDQEELIKTLRQEIVDIKEKLWKIDNSQQGRFDELRAEFKSDNAHNTARLLYQLRRCCQRQFVQVESHIARVLANLVGASHGNLSSKDIEDYLHSVFVAKKDLEERLDELRQNLRGEFDVLVEKTAARVMEDVSKKISLHLQKSISNNEVHYNTENTYYGLSENEVKKIVRDALAVYDADKTGLVDYAMESSGGQIFSTRCTENYQAHTAVLTVLGIPLWYPSNSPRTVITPGITPGDCWAFQNFPGFLVIKLSTRIKVSAFSLEHISKSSVPYGRIDSAPKNFTVFGLESEDGANPFLFGKYMYDKDGPSLQYFAVQYEGPPFEYVELRIESNHGNMNYTCLYRFRVHGDPT